MQFERGKCYNLIVKLTRQGVRDMDFGRAAPQGRSQIVKRYGSMREANQVLCGMTGHFWKCSTDVRGKDTCSKCGLDDDCIHDDDFGDGNP